MLGHYHSTLVQLKIILKGIYSKQTVGQASAGFQREQDPLAHKEMIKEKEKW